MVAFKFLPFEELVNNVCGQLTKALEEKYGAEDKVPQWRKEQLTAIKNKIKQYKKFTKILSDEEMTVALTGLIIMTKIDIEKTYWFRNADHSVLHKAIDSAIGVTEQNKLDEKSEKAAIAEYKFLEQRLPILEEYLTNHFSKEYLYFRDHVEPKIKNVVLKAVPEDEKPQPKLLKETMNIQRGSRAWLGWFSRAINFQLDDKHKVEDYRNLNKNSLFKIKEAKVVQEPEETGEEFLRKIMLGMKD